MIGPLAVLIVLAGIMIGPLVQLLGRDAALRRHCCPVERPRPERERRLLIGLQGHGQWIDTAEVGLPPDAVHRLCASVGWRVQAAFQIDRYGSMLWAVGPTPPPVTTGSRPEPTHRWLAAYLVGVVAGVAGLHLVLRHGDDLPAVPTLTVAVAVGVALVAVVSRRDPLRRPRRVVWAELTARFQGDRVRIPVWSLDRRHQLLVPQLAESLGYRPAWGGRGSVQVYRRVHPEGTPGTPPR